MSLNIRLEEIIIRTTLKPGDIGYVTYLHGLVYHKEYNYNINCEVYIAEGFCEFYRNYDLQKDSVWVAEHNGKIVGFLLLIHRKDNAAQLRYFILDPAYRGIGLGKKLISLFMESLKQKGYQTAYLWTTSELFSAAHIYKQAGFQLTEEKDSTDFGKPVRHQRYDLSMNPC
jgi:N-acetylglutamate synthase-like GNAT family acetyltransferase